MSAAPCGAARPGVVCWPHVQILGSQRSEAPPTPLSLSHTHCSFMLDVPVGRRLLTPPVGAGARGGRPVIMLRPDQTAVIEAIDCGVSMYRSVPSHVSDVASEMLG